MDFTKVKLLKELLAPPVIKSRGNIFINQEKVGKVCERTEFCATQADVPNGDKNGVQAGGNDTITLTAIKPQVIPEGRVFLHSTHPKSFDSRYQEVGLVAVSDLEGKVVAIV
jgi:Signal peptidase, peptidase S26